MKCPKCRLEVLQDMMVTIDGEEICTGCVDGLYREGLKTRGELYGVKSKHPYWTRKARKGIGNG